MSKRYIGNVYTLGDQPGWSAVFPGVVGTYIEAPWSAGNYTIGAQDFCIEAWVFPQTVSTIVGIISNYTTAGAGQFALRRTAANRLEFLYNTADFGVSTATATTTFIRPGVWNHVCVQKSNIDLYLYVNGVLDGTLSTFTGNITGDASAIPVRVGIDANTVNPFVGYISNARIVIGSALPYANAGFNPPMQLEQFSSSPYSARLLTCCGPLLDDYSNANATLSVPFTASPVGNTTIVRPSEFSPYGGTAPYNTSGSRSNTDSLGILTLQDVAATRVQRDLPYNDPLVSNQLCNVTALVRANTTTPTDNRTFVDSALGATITSFNQASQGSFSPYNFIDRNTGYSTYLNGNDTVSLTSVTAAGTGNFTYEMFCKFDSISNNPLTLMNTRTGDTADGFDFYIYNTGRLSMSYTGSEFFLSTLGGWVNTNKWYHIAVVAVGTTFTVYVDGVVVAPSPFVLASRTFTSTVLQIGTRILGASYSGYISNFRYSTSAIYTAAFTPPSAPLTATAGVTRVLTCQSSVLKNNSDVTAVTIAAGGTNSRYVNQRPVNPFNTSTYPFPIEQGRNGGSVVLDGTGDYLTTPSSTDYAVGTGDFCLECSFYYTGATNANKQIIGATDSRWALVVNTTNIVQTSDGTTKNIGTLIQGGWYHVVITVVGGTYRTFFNGVLTTTGANAYTSTATRQFWIGVSNTVTLPFTGFITGVRFVQGGIPTAYSTASTTVGATIFTPPQRPLSISDPLTAGSTKLLLNMDNYAIRDDRGFSNLVTLKTDMSSTAVTYNGYPSMYFDGTTSGYMQSFMSTNFTLGGGDFCLDLTFYPTNLGVVNYLFDIYNANTTGRMLLRTDTAGNLIAGGQNGTAFITTTLFPLVVNKWHHIAVLRTNNTMSIYINGVMALTGQTTNTTPNNSSPNSYVAIGGLQSGTFIGGACNGYMGYLRVTIGAARFAGPMNGGNSLNFVPPITPPLNQ
jgi:hypothetical protein